MAFLGGVAHDLRTPLSVLKMSFAMLEPGKPQPSEERARQAAERFRRQITRMERMLGDFLDVAKIEAGQLELRLDTHDARKIVADAVELFEGAGQDQPVEVRLPDDVVPLHCDHLRIEQVITNLVSNAIKYSPLGSPVEVVLEARGGELVLSVTDHGLGISEEDRRRVFEPFRRVGHLKESVTGVGLGLFVVRKIVEAHRGRIQVESTPSRGSTFRVFLPIARELEAVTVRGVAAPQPAGSSRVKT